MLTQQRAKEAWDATEGGIGPRSDRLVLTEAERAYVKALWETMPGSTCFMDAFFRIEQGRDLLPGLDVRDAQIALTRAALLNQRTTPGSGDFVRFVDGVLRRVSHVWGFEPALQTSDGGSWYLGDGYVSFSGSLYSAIPTETCVRTSERRSGEFIWPVLGAACSACSRVRSGSALCLRGSHD
jgi:hypothetical protein